MNATANKPSMPSNYEIAAEMGITPMSPKWKKEVAAARTHSKIHQDWEKVCKEHELSHPEIYASIQAERDRYEAAGMSHLYGGRFMRSKRGTLGMEVNGNRAVALSKKECDFLGKECGPGND